MYMSRPQGGMNTTNLSSNEQPRQSQFKAVIGLEVHCQLNTETKLFCGCPTQFGELPNHNTCPICLGLPGVLPVLNTKAVDFGIRLALAVGARLQPTSVFARKQYFYPDLPKGYQITQYDLPYAVGGGISLSDGKFIALTRIHFEEDAGKNIHGDRVSYVDLNRAGIPLLEIVTEPCIHTPEHAGEYLKRLRSIVRHLEISDGNLDEGSFRCDVNISVQGIHDKELGTRCEIKNLNSFKNIERAIQYEILRQIDLIEDGKKIVQETLLYDPALGRTQAMRSKEEAKDYRYFPDPDLKPLIISPERIERVKTNLAELPEAMANRFSESYQITLLDADQLTHEKELALFFEEVVAKVKKEISPKIVANWILSEYLREHNEKKWDFKKPVITAQNMADLLNLMAEGVISGKIAKMVFNEMVDTQADPSVIVKKKGLVQITDTSIIREAIATILANNSGQVGEYLSGKEKLFGFFVGEIMKVSKGKYNPALVNQILKELLNDQEKTLQAQK